MIILRIFLSALIALAAVFCGIYVWNMMFTNPWTRDAHVRANIVQVAPRVSGPLISIGVKNNQEVAAGQVLFQIDPTDYKIAVDQAKASLDQDKAKAAIQQRTADRDRALQERDNGTVSSVDVENAVLAANAAQAAVTLGEVALKQAQIALDRTKVKAPVSGRVVNLSLSVGDMAAAGKAMLAMVDHNSFRVDAYFLETKLSRIRIGDPAVIKLMSDGERLSGRVIGIASGISYSEDTSASLLQAPQPTFQWIRQAQRVPVEIAIDTPPKRVPLFNGATASVVIRPSGQDAK
ncbi:HlyD family secretion protein [Acidimangrovimonas sediminis]|uniref:HlyD family secretion protein n=1 Tax=Acidimangrovimonas sediminis TaxID=2056283 RepID=UPI000C807145|nr:HlyD family secretion protein [Acidimangrovimonas sediminis]